MDEPRCEGCRQLRAELRALRAEVAELRARLGQNSSNSSLPPSADPPAAPPPVVKKPTGRKPGGQPGHPPHLRQLLPPERVTATTAYVPRQCAGCQAALPARATAADPPPSRFQVIDLPDVTATVHEHQGHARTCPGCGHVTRAAVPAAVRAHSVGPGLTAALAYLTGCHGLSKRAAEEVSAAVFAAPVSLGTVSRLEAEVSAALAPAHQEALAAVRRAPAKHADETGWKRAGKLCWLWGAATGAVAAFVIHAGRGAAALAALLGDEIEGLVHSDRWHAYHALPERRRQLCWAHLKRDFVKWQQRGGAGADLGREGLAVVRQVFRAWHLFRGGGCDRARLRQRLAPARRRLTRALVAGEFGADARLARFCANLIAWEESLWRFAAVEGVEPTNNQMERLLRRAVLWRRRSFGCHSAAGCRYVERILTAVQTLRLQERGVLKFLRQTMTAHRHGLPLPQLIQTG